MMFAGTVAEGPVETFAQGWLPANSSSQSVVWGKFLLLRSCPNPPPPPLRKGMQVMFLFCKLKAWEDWLDFLQSMYSMKLAEGVHTCTTQREFRSTSQACCSSWVLNLAGGVTCVVCCITVGDNAQVAAVRKIGAHCWMCCSLLAHPVFCPGLLLLHCHVLHCKGCDCHLLPKILRGCLLLLAFWFIFARPAIVSLDFDAGLRSCLHMCRSASGCPSLHRWQSAHQRRPRRCCVPRDLHRACLSSISQQHWPLNTRQPGRCSLAETNLWCEDCCWKHAAG